MEVIDTPLGPVRVLTGQAARDYYARYLCYEEYSKHKRLTLGEAVFGPFTPISNEIHHGFADSNTALIGCYRFGSGSDTLYPVTLRSDISAYLVRGHANVVPERLRGRALPEIVRHRVCSANVLPHGGGYTYPEVTNVTSTIVIDDHRYFVLDGPCGGKRVLESLTLPYIYRGLEVMDCIRRWRLGEVVAEMHPLFSITT